MGAVKDLVALYRERVGCEVHVGEWLKIEQSRIDAFAGATGDLQWIHTDPATGCQGVSLSGNDRPRFSDPLTAPLSD